MLQNRPLLVPSARNTALLGFLLLCLGCTPARKAPASTPAKTNPGKPTQQQPPKQEPVDTVRWKPDNSGKPPIGDTPAKPTPGGKPAKPGNGDTYRIAYLLPFLTNQAGSGVPEKSRLALQFYSGAKIALQEVSETLNINLVADVYDTQSSDDDFSKLLADKRLEKPQVFIGPVRASHVATFAEWAKLRNKITISPETPNSDLTKQNPGFIQINPSLRSHCEAITQHVLRKAKPETITLVCKMKEIERLTYFQEANRKQGGSMKFNEVVVPDATNIVSGADLKKHLKSGKTNVFIVPSWGNQDFVVSFLNALKSVKGSYNVEVYGMPQWQNFDGVDAEFLTALNVHITKASYINYDSPEFKAFQKKYYEATGTIPDEDAVNGYDVTLFTAKMLAFHGLSFPELLGANAYQSLHGKFEFARMFITGGVIDGTDRFDYLENRAVHLLKYGAGGYMPLPGR
jgi:hypothetical protein